MLFSFIVVMRLDHPNHGAFTAWTLIVSVTVQASSFTSFLLFACGFLLPVFGVRVSVIYSPYVCSYYFSLVSVAEWPPFGK